MQITSDTVTGHVLYQLYGKYLFFLQMLRADRKSYLKLNIIYIFYRIKEKYVTHHVD